MHRAFTTRHAGPTDTKGSRVIVRSIKGSRVITWDYALDTLANHESAARAVARVECDGWRYKDVPSAALPDGSGYVFLFEF
jgi:hypothetical protein